MPWKDSEKAREYQKKYQAKWHQDHKAARLAEIYRRKAEVYWYIQDLKASLRCADCGFKHPAALQFHHRNKEEKVFNIGDAGRRKLSLERVKAEIKKCIVLCANCHAIRHWTERKASQSPSIAAGIAEAEQHLKATRAEREAYELVFGTSGDPDTEYQDYQEYYGVDPKNRRER